MKLSPRFSVRIQAGSPRGRAAIILVSLLVPTVIILGLVPIRELFFNFPSWRNVSIYQIVKMLLSPRPTHVGQVISCTRSRPPGVQRSDLKIDHIRFYEQEMEKLDNRQRGNEWKTAFMPALNREDKLTLMLTYGVFKSALDSAGLQHLLVHGSAMGAWRHGGMTPWDDDIDTAVHVKDWFKVKLALSCIDGYTLDVSSNSKWSFFTSQGQVTQDGVKGWPFVDIFLYAEDDRYIWGVNYVHMSKFVFLKEDMLPMQSVTFECFTVPVPRHLRRVLQHEYVDPKTCVSHHTNHKTGEARETVMVPCVQLSNIYPVYFTDN